MSAGQRPATSLGPHRSSPRAWSTAWRRRHSAA